MPREDFGLNPVTVGTEVVFGQGSGVASSVDRCVYKDQSDSDEQHCREAHS